MRFIKEIDMVICYISIVFMGYLAFMGSSPEAITLTLVVSMISCVVSKKIVDRFVK